MASEMVPSPCVSLCALDEEEVCIGCFRTGSEISHWGRLSAEQKREVLARTEARMRGQPRPCLMQRALAPH